MNPYDISKECEGDIRDTLCYPVTKHIRNYLSLPSTHKALGVDDAITGNFSSCSSSVGTAFHAASDSLHPTGLWVAGLLERGVRALIYVGEHDWICNWVGNARWVAALDWSGHAAYAGAEERVWDVDGAGAGRVRSAGPLTFATIRKAGHMVRAAPVPGASGTDARAGPVRQAEGEPRDGTPLDQGRGVLSARVQPTLSQPSARQARHVRHVLLPTVSCPTQIHCYSTRALRVCLPNSLFGSNARCERPCCAAAVPMFLSSII
jgi:hypothetical protein